MKTPKAKRSVKSKPIRILLVDDRGLVRAGLRALLERSSAMKIIGEAANKHQMLRLARQRRPDVIVLDAALPNGNGLHATALLHRRQQPQIPVILLCTVSNGDHAARAFQASASGFVLIKSKPRELTAAIRHVMKGIPYVDSAIARHLPHGRAVPCEGHVMASPHLTARQTETLQMIADGRNTKEIASALGVSPKTVDFHRSQLMDRLKTRSVAGLVREAMRRGLISRA